MVLFCLTVMSMAGCKKGEMKEENQEVDKFFYSKLPKTNQKVSEEEEKKIQKGIENYDDTEGTGHSGRQGPGREEGQGDLRH